jgi:carboxypeptidase family protein
MFYRALIISLFLQASFVLSANAGSASIQGDVLGTDGRPLQGAEVRVERKDKSGPAFTATTNARGYYVVNGVGAGVYKISVVTGGAVKSAVNIRTTGDNARVDFDMQPASGKKVKHFVWSGGGTGTNLAGRWVEVNDNTTVVAGALNSKSYNADMARDLSRHQINSTRP